MNYDLYSLYYQLAKEPLPRKLEQLLHIFFTNWSFCLANQSLYLIGQSYYIVGHRLIDHQSYSFVTSLFSIYLFFSQSFTSQVTTITSYLNYQAILCELLFFFLCVLTAKLFYTHVHCSLSFFLPTILTHVRRMNNIL